MGVSLSYLDNLLLRDITKTVIIGKLSYVSNIDLIVHVYVMSFHNNHNQ